MRDTFLDERLWLYRGYFSSHQQIFSRLLQETRWLQPGYLNEDGNTVYLPRLTANYGERSYDYSGLIFQPLPWTPLLLELKQAAERETGESFNAMIIQLYRDGIDGINWHSDASPAVGPNPTIASLSFGGYRTFEVRHKTNHSERLSLQLGVGDLLIMRGDLQHHYVHRIKKEENASPRINLTFRNIVDTHNPNTKSHTVFREVTV